MYKTALLFSLFVSCIVVVFIMFQFWNEKYEKKYQNKYLYKLLASVYVISVMSANTLMNPIANFSANMAMTDGISFWFYKEKGQKAYTNI